MDVTLEDQQKINTFSRLNNKLHELQAQISSIKVPRRARPERPWPPARPAQPARTARCPHTAQPNCNRPGVPLMQAEAEDLEEAGNELMLLDDEVAPYVVGECFVHLPKEEVEGKLEEGEC